MFCFHHENGEFSSLLTTGMIVGSVVVLDDEEESSGRTLSFFTSIGELLRGASQGRKSSTKRGGNWPRIDSR